MIDMCIKLLFFFISFVPPVPCIHTAISPLLAKFPTQQVNSPSYVHIFPKLGVSKNHLTHALSVCSVGFPIFYTFIFSFSFFINMLKWSKCTVIVVIYDLFIWRIHCVSFLPVHVTHPYFFPSKLVLLSHIMRSNIQKMSFAEGVVARSQHGFEWLYHLIYMLL